MGNLVNFSWAVFIEFFSYNGVIVNIPRIKNGTFPRFRPRFDGTFPRFDGTFPRFKSRFWLLARICRRVKRKKYLKKRRKIGNFSKPRAPFRGLGTPLRGGSVRGQMRPSGRRAPPCSLRSLPPSGEKKPYRYRHSSQAGNAPACSFISLGASKALDAFGVALKNNLPQYPNSPPVAKIPTS